MGRINNTQTGASSSSPTKSHLLIIIKKSIKFAISFSLFSFLVSYCTMFLKPTETTTSYSFTTQILDKSYMFLLCNGILVFLAKNSGLLEADATGPSSLIPDREDQESKPVRSPERGREADVSRTGFLNLDQENEPVRSPEKDQEADVSGIGFLNLAGEDQENGAEFLNFSGGDQENGFLNMSAEELNKKCDEFIKKMKEGIKLESRSQVVVVR